MSNKRGVCFCCTSKTSIKCSTCGVFLCFTSKKNCFADNHYKINFYWCKIFLFKNLGLAGNRGFSETFAQEKFI